MGQQTKVMLRNVIYPMLYQICVYHSLFYQVTVEISIIVLE